jgi:2,4'-dihydroxyacetophenone dioxygenase
MDATKIHIRTPLGEVVVRKQDLDPAKWLRFPEHGFSGYTLWVHPETGASVTLLEVEAGRGNPDRHTHASNQFMYCIEGEYEYLSSGITLRPGDFYMNPKDHPHGPTRAHKKSLLLEVYDGPHYYEDGKPRYHRSDTIGKVVHRS